jgi:hypothetical protein
MTWKLTPERRDAVVLQLLSNALHALEEDVQGDRRRVARLWIERATEVLRETSSLAPSAFHKERQEVVESLLGKIAVRLEARAAGQQRH